MELLVNDLSLHGQFPDLPSFRTALSSVMDMRQVARRFSHQLHCHRSMASAQVTRNQVMQQAIQSFGQNERRAVMQWLTQFGPFWDDAPFHGPNDYLEYNNEIVTETAVGEAAFNCLHGTDTRLVSFTHSSWEHSPLDVFWIRDNLTVSNVDVANYWERAVLEADLRNTPLPFDTWQQLSKISRGRFSNLIFSEESFEPILDYPFAVAASQKIIVLLDILNRLKACFDDKGNRNAEGQQIYRDYFTGERSWFSDSSATEKEEFRKELAFPHPTKGRKALICTWHGKVNNPKFRIHFSWPVSRDEPLYIVYIGPKRTKL